MSILVEYAKRIVLFSLNKPEKERRRNGRKAFRSGMFVHFHRSALRRTAVWSHGTFQFFQRRVQVLWRGMSEVHVDREVKVLRVVLVCFEVDFVLSCQPADGGI